MTIQRLLGPRHSICWTADHPESKKEMVSLVREADLAKLERAAGQALNDRELGTVLAALRFWQHHMSGAWSRTFTEIHDEIATDGGTFESLDQGEIDTLCERLNCGG